VTVGSSELAGTECVEAVGLTAGGAEPVARRFDLVGMNRERRQPSVMEPLNEQPVRPLGRQPATMGTDQSPAEVRDPFFFVGDSCRPQPFPVLVRDHDGMIVLGPIHTSAHGLV
jgi:hypothetical protein